jgi:membrane associated rhomboid family serine protease
VTPLLWAIAVIAAFHAQNTPQGSWEDRGDMDAWAVFHGGEFWRPATALFLHWDVGHLVSNLIAGIFIFTSLVSAMGVLRGWLLVFAASVAGNLLVGAVHYPAPYRSLGASTAIFAALGLLTGRAVRRVLLSGRLREWRPVFIPLASGVALLGIFGAGGVNADIAAHASGFGMGLAIGFAASGRIEPAGRLRAA